MTLEEFDDDALATLADEMQVEGRRLLLLADQARFELTRRLQERSATHLETDNYIGTLRPGALTHETDVGMLQDLKRLVPPAVWQGIFIPKPLVVDQRQLNELLKLGGEVRAVIENARITKRGEPRLELRKKEGVKIG